MGTFFRDERGATAVEYALVAGVLVLAILVGFLQLQGSLDETYTQNRAEIGSAVDDAGD